MTTKEKWTLGGSAVFVGFVLVMLHGQSLRKYITKVEQTLRYPVGSSGGNTMIPSTHDLPIFNFNDPLTQASVGDASSAY